MVFQSSSVAGSKPCHPKGSKHSSIFVVVEEILDLIFQAVGQVVSVGHRVTGNNGRSPDDLNIFESLRVAFLNFEQRLAVVW